MEILFRHTTFFSCTPLKLSTNYLPHFLPFHTSRPLISDLIKYKLSINIQIKFYLELVISDEDENEWKKKEREKAMIRIVKKIDILNKYEKFKIKGWHRK